ncbi:MAG: hypothetical protein JWN39_3486, partial [Ilumatobacteraceae bacterium]|nr:hypothetical protein [Ilumatobacteraceae bacterium]
MHHRGAIGFVAVCLTLTAVACGNEGA